MPASGGRKRKRGAEARRIDVDVLCHSVLGANIENAGYEWINAMDISGDGTVLSAGCADSSVRVWRLDGNVLGTELGEHDALKRYASSAAGAGDTSGFPSHRASADAATTSGLRLVGHAGSVFSATSSGDLRWLVSGGGDTMVKLWDLRVSSRGSVPFCRLMLRATDEFYSILLFCIALLLYCSFALARRQDWRRRVLRLDPRGPRALRLGRRRRAEHDISLPRIRVCR